MIDQLAARCKARRLAENWSRKTLSERSGVSESIIKRFETSGSIKLEDIVQLAVALNAAAEFGGLFPEKAVTNLNELPTHTRKRGRQ